MIRTLLTGYINISKTVNESVRLSKIKNEAAEHEVDIDWDKLYEESKSYNQRAIVYIERRASELIAKKLRQITPDITRSFYESMGLTVINFNPDKD